MTTDTAENTSVTAVTKELTINEARKVSAENHAMNFALIGGDIFNGYEADFVTRALTEKRHPMFNGISPN